MTYLFTGMIIGGLVGLTIGALAAAAGGEHEEVMRLKKEIREMKNSAESKSKS